MEGSRSRSETTERRNAQSEDSKLFGEKRKGAQRREKSGGRSMAESSTSTTWRCRRRVVFMRQASREDEYEGLTRNCHHSLVAPRWTSWTEGNPGRRFYGYRNYCQMGAVVFFAWHDGEFGDRENAVIKDLLNDIDKLYDENTQLRRGNDGEVRKLKAAYGNRESEVRSMEMKFRVAMLTLIITWVWLVVCIPVVKGEL